MTALTHNSLFLPLVLTIAIILVFPLLAGYIVLIERKVLADFQVRLGPMRVGPHGLLQPLADALKLILKEDTIPGGADKAIFWVAPVISTFTALTAFAVLPFSGVLYVADVNIGILFISAMAAIGVLGIILGGWSSNSHYPLLGALRGAAQLVSYEVALGLALLAGVMLAGTLSMTGIVRAQLDHHVWFVFGNYGLMILPFFVYMISATAETNRTPFDLPEAESELVAGYHTEFSGFRWALYMLSEYANIFVAAAVIITLFWGGWLRPFPNIAWLDIPFRMIFPATLFGVSAYGTVRLGLRQRTAIQKAFLLVVAMLLALVGAVFLIPIASRALSGPFWFFFKVSVIIYALIWFRGTFPRLRYDQLMGLGWKYMIPLALAAIFLNAIVGML
ncbi:MAG TPA: complex I subunit 1 family protein [Bryobacteraceae bacterium]|nr:complex I subunit 1 family protein [Bryobacteraceae bacterium]